MKVQHFFFVIMFIIIFLLLFFQRGKSGERSRGNQKNKKKMNLEGERQEQK